MSYRREHAEGVQPYQPTEQIPPSIYAASLDRDVVLSDIRFVQEKNSSGVDQAQASRLLSDEHSQHPERDAANRATVERYADRLAEFVYERPELTAAQQIAQLQPSLDERRHWEPLVQSIGMEHAEPFAWRGEHAEIQSYRSEEPRGWLHIDSQGQFFDRNAQPLATQVALEPFGLSSATTHGIDQNMAIEKSSTLNNGSGFSM